MQAGRVEARGSGKGCGWVCQTRREIAQDTRPKGNSTQATAPDSRAMAKKGASLAREGTCRLKLRCLSHYGPSCQASPPPGSCRCRFLGDRQVGHPSHCNERVYSGRLHSYRMLSFVADNDVRECLTCSCDPLLLSHQLNG